MINSTHPDAALLNPLTVFAGDTEIGINQAHCRNSAQAYNNFRLHQCHLTAQIVDAGILLCFLGGLMAVDLVPRNAAGAAMGVVAVLTYAGAAVQSRVSAMFIETSAAGDKLASRFVTTTVFGCEIDAIALFWIGMAALSVLCALSVWKAKPRD